MNDGADPWQGQELLDQQEQMEMEYLKGLELLRRPFEPHHISRLPKPTKAQTDEVKADFKKGIRCEECGGWHHPKVVHLDYVGHAALTDRLLDADPCWYWEPLAMNNGLPVMDSVGGMWIKLTVCGVTRLGYGHAGDKSGGDAIKEVIGDALRNAAMRFGAALELWHKGVLHKDDEGEPEAKPNAMKESAKSIARAEFDGLQRGAQMRLEEISRAIKEKLMMSDVGGAVEIVDHENLDPDMKVALWALLDSKQRSAIKEYGKRKAELDKQNAPMQAAA